MWGDLHLFREEEELGKKLERGLQMGTDLGKDTRKFCFSKYIKPNSHALSQFTYFYEF